MGKQTKLFTLATLLLVAVLTVSSLISVQAISLKDVGKPSVPEFTVELVFCPYDVPPETTTSVDLYTGKEITTTEPGYWVENRSIEITIKNQPLPTHLINGKACHLYYNIRTKAHFGQDWTELYPLIGRPSSPWDEENRTFHISNCISDKTPAQSNSEFTVLSFSANYAQDAQVDFQVQAVLGFDSKAWVIEHGLMPTYGGYYEPDVQFDSSSQWSDTQTVTIDRRTPTATPIEPVAQTGVVLGLNWEQTALIGMAVAIIILTVSVVLLWHNVATSKKGKEEKS